MGYHFKNHHKKTIGKNDFIKKTAESRLPTRYGIFNLAVYKSSDGSEHVALIKGNIQAIMLVRIHSSCLTGDVFSSMKCDCGEQLKQSMRQIGKNGSGIIIYLNQEGRGIGLTDKIRAYAIQEKGYDTVEANQLLGLPIDARDYKIAAEILFDLGITRIRLLTNNPQKEKQLFTYGIENIERLPLETIPNETNKEYLKTKKYKLSHRLTLI